jgi:hypothetical protein
LVVTILFLLPEGQVLLKELDDALGITEVVFLELVDLVESFLEGAVSELARNLVVLHHLVMEHGKVEGQAELDGVAWGQGNLVSLVVGLKGFLLNLLKQVSLCVFSNVAVVVTDHLDEECLRLTIARFVKNLGGDHVDDALAIGDELGLDALLVIAEGIGIFGVLRVLLDCSNRAAGGTFGADEVLEGN